MKEPVITCCVDLALSAEVRNWLKDVFAPVLATTLVAQMRDEDFSLPARHTVTTTTMENNSNASVLASRLLVTKREASRLLSVSVRTLDYRISQKQLQVRRVGSRVLIPMKEVRRFAARDHF